MSNRQTQTRRRQSERGAALVVAIAIMTILLAVALTFYAVSRQEVDNAVNVRNQVQTGLLVDSALAIAQAKLNREFLNNPNATSLDSAPFSLFNGSWAVGKQWALWGGTPLQNGGVPLVNLSAMPFLDFGDGLPPEQMFNGARSRGWLTIPRFEGANPVAYADVLDDSTGVAYPYIFRLNDYARPPFVTPAFYGPSLTDGGVAQRYPLEWIHTWTDVDNDGDGLNDAIWIPLPQDRYFSGGEFRDELGRRQYDDGVDNDLDGIVDNEPEAGEGEMELGVFVYWGGDDGLDNDGDGAVDEAGTYATSGEQDYFLTAPLTGITVYLDFNADGKVPDLVPNAAGALEPLRLVIAPADIIVQTASGPVTLPAANNNHVDRIDNDFDMLINDYNVYAYVGPNTLSGAPFVISGFQDTGVPDGYGGTIVTTIETPNADNTLQSNFAAAKLKEYTPITLSQVLGGLTSVQVVPNAGAFGVPTAAGVYPNTYDYDALLRPIAIFSHSGEPVCEIAGRAAITIRDEASKLNVNIAGGHTYNPLDNDVQRSLGLGATTAELETRVLPEIDAIRAESIWTYRAGGPGGDPAVGYEADTTLAGLGRIDDNANALVSSFNGRDDDGDGLIDEGLFLPLVSPMAERFLAGTPLPGDDPASVNAELDSTRYRDYFNQLGAFEGVDEPAEFQRFNPLSNLAAEGRNPYQVSPAPLDAVDNDFDGVVNERGELGDLLFQDTLQLGDVTAANIGFDVRRARLLKLTGAYSTDRNATFVSGQDGITAVNKLDYNFATPTQIAANLLLTNPFQSVTARPLITNTSDPRHLEVNRYAEGLRQGDLHIRSQQSGLLWVADGTGAIDEPTVSYFAADPVLRAMQAAVDIVDNRDTDHTRSTLTSEKNWLGSNLPGAFDFFPRNLVMRERIAEGSLLPLSELQDHLRNSMAINRKLEIRDDWWTFAASPSSPTGGVIGETGAPEVRHISYSTTGNEAIKINEMMVRAVRRVEAEAIPDDTLVGADDPMVDVTLANYNFFDPTPEGDKFPIPTTQPLVLPEFTLTRQTLTNSNWTNYGTPFLGDGAGIATVSTNIDEGTIPESIEDAVQYLIYPTDPTDTVIDGLPSGRYYLTVKASLNGAPLQGNQLAYSIKYVDFQAATPETTILEDLSAAAALGAAQATYLPARWTTVPAAHVASGQPGEPVGWAFVDGTPQALAQTNGYFTDGGYGAEFGAPSTGLPYGTFTVSVPSYVDSNGDGFPDRALCIAFSTAPGVADGQTLRIDALDFSQEPDHEWLELVNSSDEEVNVGGWNLEVGIPDKPGIPRDPFKSRWRIPDNTTVAPGGMVLLSFNKYDHYRALGGVSQLNDVADRVSDNGIGLAAGGLLPHTANLTDTFVTVPDIRDTSSNGAYVPVGFPLDPTGSVFRRFAIAGGYPMDYIDRDGDGLSSMYALGTDTDASQTEAVVRSTRELGSAVTAGLENHPWDRIVQLECLQYASVAPTQVTSATVTLDQIVTVDDVARMVLKGGVFPNYPEQDGYDNDGDGGYVVIGDINGDTFTEPIYVAGILDRDMIDNDLNAYVDERGTALSTDGTDQFDYFGALDASLGDGVNQFLSEGVDEGRGVRAGEYLPGTIGALFFNSRELGVYPSDDPTGNPFNYFDFNALTVGTYLGFTPEGATGLAVGPVSQAYLDARVSDPVLPYMGSIADPPEWKAFVERRWYPGDNVIVTLYTSEISEDTVVDRVTYREQDVTNRTIDDVVPWSTFYPAGTELNAQYPGIWRPDHMGLDFYRSLERKHPFYNGDRFGTTNRWEATDGNYDDWADSLSFYEAELPSDAADPLLISAGGVVDPRTRFPSTATPSAAQVRNFRLFGHAIWGTPLRMNSAARVSENPSDLGLLLDTSLPATADRRQFPNPLSYFRSHEDGLFDPGATPVDAIRTIVADTRNSKSLQNQSWNHSKAYVANEPYNSPGDLMRVPHQIYLHDAFNLVNGHVRDMTLLNYGLQGDGPLNDGVSYKQDISLRGATLGQDGVDDRFSRNILTAAIGSMALESVVLTVGQAEMRPMLPDASAIQADPDLLRWVGNTGSNPNDLLAPAAWAPVFLFELDRDTDSNVREEHFPNYPAFVNGTTAGALGSVQFDLNYLFNQSFLTNLANFGGVDVYNNNLNDKWPLEQRVAMYVSENRSTSPAPSEALFTWDGEDGLENGEYVLYVGTFIPGMRSQVEEAAQNAARVVDSAAIGVNGKNTRNLLPTTDQATGVTTTLLLEDGTTLTLPNGTPVDVSPVTRSVLERDPSSPKRINRHFDPVLALDVITNPTEARGEAPPASGPSKPAGLIAPADWNPAVQYRPGSNGYIFYGANAVGGWKPHIVRVTDNFLALRVRNLGEPGEVAAITHIVLAPRKRTAGRVNVNTTDSRLSAIGGRQEYYNSILSIPGVVNAASSVLPSPPNSTFTAPYVQADVLTAMTDTTPPANGWASPTDLYGAMPHPTPPFRNNHNPELTTDTDLLVPDTYLGKSDRHRIGAFRLGAMIIGGRTEYADGRYYTSVGDLVDVSRGFDFEHSTGRAHRPQLTGPGVDSTAIYPLSNESLPWKRFDEMQLRLDQIGNLATVRSDVFEILMTVESGYGVDRNSDGFINYRDPNEFVTTGASKASATYERRSPSDTTDAGE